MQVILHIGTHKTGTSALQTCLRKNQKALAKRGIHYAHMRPHKHCNGLASLVAKKHRAQAKTFVHDQVGKARSLGAETLIMSAESLYAMTIFFHRFNGRRSPNYWELEAEAVEDLSVIFPSGVTMKLVVFFRRQDQFLESLYRQLVVAPRALAMPIDEFADFVGEALDYWRHMTIWRATFPCSTAHTYEEAKYSVPAFFIRHVLGITQLDEFEGLNTRINVRLNRDVIEYKRMLNCLDGSPVDRYLDFRACIELGRLLGNKDRYQSFLTPRARVELLGKVEQGNRLLCEQYGMSSFPAVDLKDVDSWEAYPGLSSQKARELAERHAAITRRPGYILERAALLAKQFAQRRIPTLGRMIPGGIREYIRHTMLRRYSHVLPAAITKMMRNGFLSAHHGKGLQD